MRTSLLDAGQWDTENTADYGTLLLLYERAQHLTLPMSGAVERPLHWLVMPSLTSLLRFDVLPFARANSAENR
jgi:hypothetical protein